MRTQQNASSHDGKINLHHYRNIIVFFTHHEENRHLKEHYLQKNIKGKYILRSIKRTTKNNKT